MISGVFWRLRELCQGLTDQQYEDFKLFQVELLRFNQRLNLISPNTEANADIIHFYDSIVAMQYFQAHENSPELFDLGSGNGFPGVVFAILNPEVRITLVDSDARKTEFLKYLVDRLGRNNIKVICDRIEDVKFGKTVAVCRGLASLAKTLLMTKDNMNKDSVIYSMKGPKWFAEVASLPHQICSTWNTEMAFEYSLPQNQGDRVLLKSKKTL